MSGDTSHSWRHVAFETQGSWRGRRSLAESFRFGESFRFVELANDVNKHMPGYVVRRVIESSTAIACR